MQRSANYGLQTICGPRATNSSYALKGLQRKKSKKNTSTHVTLGRSHCSVHKVFLGHRHIHVPTQHLGLLSLYNSRAQSLQWSLYGAQSLKYLPSGPLQRLPAPVPKWSPLGKVEFTATDVVLKANTFGRTQAGWWPFILWVHHWLPALTGSSAQAPCAPPVCAGAQGRKQRLGQTLRHHVQTHFKDGV